MERVGGRAVRDVVPECVVINSRVGGMVKNELSRGTERTVGEPRRATGKLTTTRQFPRLGFYGLEDLPRGDLLVFVREVYAVLQAVLGAFGFPVQLLMVEVALVHAQIQHGVAWE